MSTRKLLAITLGPTALLVAALTVGVVMHEQADPYRAMSCDDLTTQMLKMTGTDATEPYDLTKVRTINEARAEKGCP